MKNDRYNSIIPSSILIQTSERFTITPNRLAIFFPAEFDAHEAIWLSWPHKEASWPGKIETIYPNYSLFVKYVSLSEKVRINVTDEAMKSFATGHLEQAGVNMEQVEFFSILPMMPGAAIMVLRFLINPSAQQKKVIVDWNYNAWGNKYPPYDLDDVIPTLIGRHFNIPVYHPGIIMEGGSVEFNGNGTVLTSTCCLLNPNRNPQLNQSQIEKYLCEFYGMQQVLWVDEGIVGDDTDGHIDDTVRFVNENTVLAVVETDKRDENYTLLQNNLAQLQQMRLWNGKQLNIIELPMPDAVIHEDQRLPASYANFYISNRHVIVPTYRCANDDRALRLIQDCFPGREAVGIDSTDIIWGLGSFHCLSQQEPAV